MAGFNIDIYENIAAKVFQQYGLCFETAERAGSA